MTPHCVKEGLVSLYHLRVFGDVVSIVDNISQPDLTCHDVCRMVADELGAHLRVMRGKFNYYDHSWLAFRDDPRIVIDAYPWACASGPFLVDCRTGSPWALLYKVKQDGKMEDDPEGHVNQEPPQDRDTGEGPLWSSDTP
jgi:hypothetical protein